MANYLKIIVAMLEKGTIDFLPVIDKFVQTLLNDQNLDYKAAFDEVIAPLTAILVIKDDSLQPFVQKWLEMIT
jgi:hypothetical protein